MKMYVVTKPAIGIRKNGVDKWGDFRIHLASGTVIVEEYPKNDSHRALYFDNEDPDETLFYLEGGMAAAGLVDIDYVYSKLERVLERQFKSPMAPKGPSTTKEQMDRCVAEHRAMFDLQTALDYKKVYDSIPEVVKSKLKGVPTSEKLFDDAIASIEQCRGM